SLQHADDAGSGLSYVSAIAVEERQVLAYNEGDPGGDPGQVGRHAPPRVPLAAVYPKEGTLISDYPFVVLNAAWVSAAQRAAAADLLQFLLSAKAQARLVAAGYRDANGRPGPALTPAAGLLPDHPTAVIKDPPGSVLAALQSSWWSVRKPARVLVIVDTSGSMDDDVPGTGHTKIELVKAALTAALGRIGDNDEIGLWTFSDTAQEEVPIGRVGDQRARLATAVAAMTAGGSTALYATVQSGLDAMTAHADPGHIPAIVVLTDGADTSSSDTSFEDLLRAESTQPPNTAVRVFTIAYGADADQAGLQRIAGASQATAYDASDPQLIQQVFNGVLSNF
ncbi:MAG TPA: VWA domain-containing protein, partial [Candidatus Dormibacteraeota bacterium]|nr:VWA domain-containing protein [Candidatus Dormibacteraeota bacterium]